MNNPVVTIPMLPLHPVEPPEGAPPEVLNEFRQLVKLMDGRATPADALLLHLLAAALATWKQAQAQIAAEGTRVASGGTVIVNPSLAIAAQAHNQIVQLCEKLGLSPASRKRLKLAKAKAKQPNADDWMHQ